MRSQKRSILYMIFLLSPFVAKVQSYNLNFYLDQAKKNSPVIHKSANDNKLITLNIKQVKAVLSKPEISIDGTITFAPIISHYKNANRFEWVSSGSTNYTGYDLALTDGGQYQAGISIKQPLFRGSEYKAYSQKEDIAHQINGNQISLNIHQLEQLINYQYILCLKSKKQIELSLEGLEQINSQVELMNKLVASAIYKQTDLMLLQIEQDNIAAHTRIFQSDYKNNLYDLNLLCGINDTTLVDIQDVVFEINTQPSTPSHFLTTYALDSMKILTNQNIFNQKYKPKLFLFSNAGLNSIYLPSLNRLGFSLGLTFNWTIFDGQQRNIQQQKSVISHNTLEFEKQNFETQIKIQKNKSLQQIHTLEEREKIAKVQIKKYYELILVYQKELSVGDISIMDLKTLMRDVLTKQQELVVIEMQRQAIINSYNYWNY